MGSSLAKWKLYEVLGTGTVTSQCQAYRLHNSNPRHHPSSHHPVIPVIPLRARGLLSWLAAVTGTTG